MVTDKCPKGPIGLNRLIRLSPNGLIGPIGLNPIGPIGLNPKGPKGPKGLNPCCHVSENVQIGSLSAILSVT